MNGAGPRGADLPHDRPLAPHRAGARERRTPDRRGCAAQPVPGRSGAWIPGHDPHARRGRTTTPAPGTPAHRASLRLTASDSTFQQPCNANYAPGQGHFGCRGAARLQRSATCGPPFSATLFANVTQPAHGLEPDTGKPARIFTFNGEGSKSLREGFTMNITCRRG